MLAKVERNWESASSPITVADENLHAVNRFFVMISFELGGEAASWPEELNTVVSPLDVLWILK